MWNKYDKYFFYASGAIEKGIVRLSHKMKGRETWVIVVLCFSFIVSGSTYGMDAEAMAFYPILVPVFLAAGIYEILKQVHMKKSIAFLVP